MFIVIVPLIFLTISSSIIKMDSPKRFGKIVTRVFLVFVILSVISALIGIASNYSVKLVNSDNSNIMELSDDNTVLDIDLSILKKLLVYLLNFNLLLSKKNIIAILVFAILFSLTVRKSKEKGKYVSTLLISLNGVVLSKVNIIIYYAPISLGCYFDSLIGTYDSSIVVGFLKYFYIYNSMFNSIFCFLFIYSLYALIAGGKNGLKSYWSHINSTFYYISCYMLIGRVYSSKCKKFY